MNTWEDEWVSEEDRNDDREGMKSCNGYFKVSSGREKSKSCHWKFDGVSYHAWVKQQLNLEEKLALQVGYLPSNPSPKEQSHKCESLTSKVVVSARARK